MTRVRQCLEYVEKELGLRCPFDDMIVKMGQISSSRKKQVFTMVRQLYCAADISYGVSPSSPTGRHEMKYQKPQIDWLTENLCNEKIEGGNIMFHLLFLTFLSSLLSPSPSS